jgi:hypothetical protein
MDSMLRRTFIMVVLVALAGIATACSMPGTRITNPPPAPSTGAPAPANPGVEGGGVVAQWVELTAQGKSTDGIVVKDATSQSAFSDLKDLKVLKFIDSTPEVIRPEEMVLKVNIVVQPMGGAAKDQTYYATVVKAQGAWKVMNIGLAKP